MWTDESRAATLIFNAVTTPVVQRVLYQSQMHIENFRSSKALLHEAFHNLNFHNFARSQSCHMTDGIFGDEIHASQMESAKIRVWGYLLNTTTAGHKFLRCLENARANERKRDWKIFRDDLKTTPDIYRRTRNFLEHLDQATADEKVADIEDCKLTILGILCFSDNEGRVEFDITPDGLASIELMWSKLLEMLKTRLEVQEQPFA